MVDKTKWGYNEKGRFLFSKYNSDFLEYAASPEGIIEIEKNTKERMELAAARKRRKYETAKSALENPVGLTIQQRKQYRQDLELFDE
jgi:hypothetical protein|tara:strand:- start:762 stop:1022 length:261 start_codon:yes stop_codon:yes gene_type:complete